MFLFFILTFSEFDVNCTTFNRLKQNPEIESNEDLGAENKFQYKVDCTLN